MSKINLVFPHQLFEHTALLKNGCPFYLIEEQLFFNQYSFHKQKLVLHRASMKFYQSYLKKQGASITYIEATNDLSDIRKLIPHLAGQGVKEIVYYDPVDDWLGQRLQEGIHNQECKGQMLDSLLFLNQISDLKDFFKEDKQKLLHHDFYLQQRRRRKILLNEDGSPQGGQWSFDKENRQKYPKKKQPPAITYPKEDDLLKAAKGYVMENFINNPGDLADSPNYPHTFKTSREWLDRFLDTRFSEFGPYEDAMVAQEGILNHSVLTPMLNIGLITPNQVVEAVLSHCKENDVPLNSTEGFIRQIIGWREFIRGIYHFNGRQQRVRNYWAFSRKIPKSFYDGTTGIDPVDIVIKKVLARGYCHHIERLMVLGNFMLLVEFDPQEVYRWFMEMFIDSYDWVMVPNVYGMSQFADGGLMATKPYISGSNYLRKMSDFKRGDWEEIWDGLFWRFMHEHRSFFTNNPRLGMLVKNLDRMDESKRHGHLEVAESYLKSLDSKDYA